MISLWMVGKSCTTKLGCFFNISHGMFTINWCRISLAHPQSLSLYTYIYIYYIIIYHIPMIFHIIPILSIHDTFSTEISPFPVGTTGFQRQYRFMSWSLMAVTSWVQLASWRHGMGRMIYRSIYLYIYIYAYVYMYIFVIYIYMYTCMYISIFRIYRLDDVYVRNNSLGGEMHGIPCGTAISWVVSVRVFRTLRACKIWFLPASHCIFALTPKLHFEAYLKDILCNLQCFEPLTETSTSRKTLQEPQTNLTLNN